MKRAIYIDGAGVGGCRTDHVPAGVGAGRSGAAGGVRGQRDLRRHIHCFQETQDGMCTLRSTPMLACRLLLDRVTPVGLHYPLATPNRALTPVPKLRTSMLGLSLWVSQGSMTIATVGTRFPPNLPGASVASPWFPRGFLQPEPEDEP